MDGMEGMKMGWMGLRWGDGESKSFLRYFRVLVLNLYVVFFKV